MDTVIEVENLSKKYIIGHQRREHYTALRDVIADKFKNTGKRLLYFFTNSAVHQSNYADREEIWALKDVSFEVKQGERLGIIGRNGAGKTTLLRILSRITEPTAGKAKIRGRVASLLEVGTGFHPELTGRENIYLNGAVLGMSKTEIKKKFDEIVAFAEIEKFLDTPVKRYSSGMYVRLAFAVAAHLEPEILLVDEVLAVGDVAFQKKCLGKMGEVAKEGRTVIFVSHNMQAIRKLCQRTILINQGQMISDDVTEKTIFLYNEKMRQSNVDANTAINDLKTRRGSGAVRFTAISILDDHAYERFNFSMGETIRFKMAFKVMLDVPNLAVSVALRSGVTGEIVTSVEHTYSSHKLIAGSEGELIIEFPDIYIRPGEYPLYFWLGGRTPFKRPFDVVDNLTAPLVINAEVKSSHSNFDLSQPIGYFSIPSKVLGGKNV